MYTPLNNVTSRDSYSSPQIADILSAVQGDKYFTTMDCAQGFCQIDVNPRDRQKTAFSTPIGNFQFNRCPFGACNSCAHFQRQMNTIFRDRLYERCVIYVDDIFIVTQLTTSMDIIISSKESCKIAKTCIRSNGSEWRKQHRNAMP